METLKGTLRGIRYSGRNYWSVAQLEPAGADALLGMVTIVGPLVAVDVGDSLELTGDWEEDAKYGRQFKFKKVATLTPSDHEGVVAWLTRLPELGRARAIEIVRAVGVDQIWHVLEHEPQRLTSIAGITAQRAEAIRRAYLGRRAERDQMVFLKRWGLTDYQCGRIVEQFGAGAEKVLRENPYRLTKIDGFGFKTVDVIALRLGVSRDHIERARAAALYMLDVAKQMGHTFVPIKSLAKRCQVDLEVPAKRVREAVELLVEDGDLVVTGDGEGGISDVYLTELHVAEVRIAGRLAALRRAREAT